MITPQDAISIQESIQNAKTIYVALGSNPNYDTVASALSLYLSFKEAGKNVQIACAAPMRVEFSYLIGVDEVKNKVGNRNLLISFAYNEASVDKVSYSMSEDGQRFNLVIAPQTGAKPLDPATIDYSFAGAAADLVFLVGVSQLQDLGALYEQEKYFFDSADSVSITSFQVPPFARRTFDTMGQSCMAEGVAVLLSSIGLEPKDDIATNLLSSVEQATNRFQSLGAGPDTFELIARLMRNGARRSATNPVIHQPEQSFNQQPGGGFPQPGMPISPSFVQQPRMPQPAGMFPPAQSGGSTSAFAQALKKMRSLQQAGQNPNMPHAVSAQAGTMPSMFPRTHIPTPQQVAQQQYQPVQEAFFPGAPPPMPYEETQQGQQDNQQIIQLERQLHEQAQSVVTNPPAEWTQPKIYTGTSTV